MELKELKKKIPYQWRVQEFSKYKAEATCVAYIDARDVMELLDEVCGPENWQSDYKDVGCQMFAGIGIKTPSPNKDWPDWVWKWDTGSESTVEAEKGQASDSFKRAAVKWGVGRFLYELPVKRVKANAIKSDTVKPHVVDDAGNRVWDITKHINGSTPKTPEKSAQKPTEVPQKVTPPKSIEDTQLAMASRIAKLCEEIDGVPFMMPDEVEKSVMEHTGMEMTPANYMKIGLKLAEINNQNGK